ncbi:MAG TPA: serine hydrolase domain-containing protein, partial [Flavitalea sp.]|nr:serine hydrolase domain-containing protein [Flavitalea sp.]
AIRIDFPTETLIDSLKREALQFKPGAHYSYSNSNYFLLGKIIEKVSGQSYQQYLEEHIFKPLGLSGTYYDNPASIIPNRASGYSKNDRNFENVGYISMSLVYAAGALLSNVRDLFKWHTALIAGNMVSKPMLKKAFTPYSLRNGEKSEYGYGWFIKDFNGQRAIAHGGSIDGFRSMGTYLPDKDLYVIILVNSDNEAAQKLFEDIVNLAAGITTTSYKDLQLADSILDRYLGTYQYAGADTTIKEAFRIYKETNRLYADLSNGTGSHMALYPQSETHFILAIRKPITIDFIIQNGKVTELIATQKEKNKFIKIE